MNVVLFLVSLYEALNYFRGSFANFAFSSVLLLTTGKLIWDTYILIRDLSTNEKLDNLTICNKEIKYTKLQLEGDYELVTHRWEVMGNSKTARIVFSKSINDHLIRQNDQDINIEPCKGKQQKVRDFIESNYNSLRFFIKLQYRESKAFNKDYFNETKLCLSEDIKVGESIKFHKGTYFDTVLTNFVAGKYIEDNSGAIIADFTSLNIIKKGSQGFYLKSITETDFNNHIGISTIAITKDHFIVLWIQNNRAQSSNGLIVPTGSGSCDYSDLSQLGFIGTIKNAMGRELLEESTKVKACRGNLAETKVLGFYRWLDKGGKPEFVGVTKLNLNYNDLKNNLQEVRLGNSHEDYKLTRRINSLKDLSDYLMHELKSNKHLSVPLYFNMLSLVNYISDFESNAEFLLFGPPEI